MVQLFALERYHNFYPFHNFCNPNTVIGQIRRPPELKRHRRAGGGLFHLDDAPASASFWNCAFRSFGAKSTKSLLHYDFWKAVNRENPAVAEPLTSLTPPVGLFTTVAHILHDRRFVDYRF